MNFLFICGVVNGSKQSEFKSSRIQRSFSFGFVLSTPSVKCVYMSVQKVLYCRIREQLELDGTFKGSPLQKCHFIPYEFEEGNLNCTYQIMFSIIR